MEFDLRQWETAAWLAAACTWIQERLHEAGIQLTGPIEQPHIRPWATVLRVPTDRGHFFFKAAIPAVRHELAVLALLTEERAEYGPELLAMDPGRGWVLMAGAGERLRDVLKADGDLGHWHRLLPAYAALQRDLASAAERLVDRGVTDRRLAALPAEFDVVTADTALLGLNQPAGMSPEEHRLLQDSRAEFVAACEALAEYGIPETIDHGDLHDGNIFLSGERYTLIDWGDSSVTHPFFSLRVALVSIESTLDLEEDSPILDDMAARYLTVWEAYGSPERLRHALTLARRIAFVVGALNWRRALSMWPEPYPAGRPRPVAALLRAWLAG